MGIAVLRDVDVLAGGYRLRGVMNSVALTDSAELQEATVFGDAARRRLSGLKSAQVSMEGFWDSAIDAVLQANLGLANVPVTIAPEGNTEGARAFFFRCLGGEYQVLGAVGEVNPFSFSAQGSDGARLVRGTLMHNATRSTSANGTAQQLGAIGATQNLYAALHVLSASAADTLDVIVTSDNASNFPSPTTRITFTQAAAIGSQWVVLAGAVTDDWWRVQWTIAGTSPSFEFVAVLGIL